MISDLEHLIMKPPPSVPDMTFVWLMLLVAVIAFALGFAIAKRIK